jgi:chromosome segregation ATPase
LVLRAIRDKDTYLKLHARLELIVANIKMSTPTLIKLSEDLKRQLETIKSDERYNKREITKLRDVIDTLTLEFLKQDKLEKSDSDGLRDQITFNRKAAQELEVESGSCSQLERNVEQIKVEKELKDRELIRAKNKLRSLKNDWAIEDLAIQDASKRFSEAQSKLKEFQVLCEQAKNERNKYVNHIQSSSQRAAEMKEKLKILSNEIEILRQEIFAKDRDLAV